MDICKKEYRTKYLKLRGRGQSVGQPEVESAGDGCGNVLGSGMYW